MVRTPNGAVGDSLPDAGSVLLLSSSAAEEVCVDLQAAGPGETEALWIDFDRSPDERLRAFRTHAGEDPPAAVTAIDVGGEVRSTAAGGAVAIPRSAGSIEVAAIPDPGDLTALGVAVTDRVSGLAEGRRLVVCVHSITALLRHADLERAFRFLEVLSGQLRAVDALAHYHMDPEAHDDRTVRTVEKLFDVVLEVDPSGATTVR